MPAIPLSSLIETLVHAIASDAQALRERHVLRQALHGLVRQALVEQAGRERLEMLRQGTVHGVREEACQQACAHQRRAGVDYPVH